MKTSIQILALLSMMSGCAESYGSTRSDVQRMADNICNQDSRYCVDLSRAATDFPMPEAPEPECPGGWMRNYYSHLCEYMGPSTPEHHHHSNVNVTVNIAD